MAPSPKFCKDRKLWQKPYCSLAGVPMERFLSTVAVESSFVSMTLPNEPTNITSSIYSIIQLSENIMVGYPRERALHELIRGYKGWTS